MTPPKNTHKNKAITAFINRFALTCLLASTAMLTACIGTGGDSPGDVDFSARSFVLPASSSIEASTATGVALNGVALRYLTSIGFQGYERQGTVFGTAIRGNFDGNTDRLDAEDGFLLIETKGEVGNGGHVFAGRFDTTDVGDELTDATPTATFSGPAALILVHATGGGASTKSSLSRRVHFNDLELTVNFDAKSLTGTVTGSTTNSADSLTVDGRFSEKRLSGSVRMNLADPAIVDLASRSAFTATLNGVIGADGAVGVFNNHLARDRASDYALGGGFVVKAPPPAANP